MNWASAFCKVFNSCVCWLLSLNPRKPASCLGQIPVYHPKGISLTHSIVHRSHSWTHSLPNTSNTWTFCFLFSRSFWQEIWWTGTSTTRWAGKSLATRWSSTISIENRFRRKGQSFFCQKIRYNIQCRDVSSMATVLQDIGKFRKQIQRRLNLRRICWS